MANKSYRNKPDRIKGNRTRKEKRDNLREVPSHVWEDVKYRTDWFKEDIHYPKTLHQIGKMSLESGKKFQ